MQWRIHVTNRIAAMLMASLLVVMTGRPRRAGAGDCRGGCAGSNELLRQRSKVVSGLIVESTNEL